MIRLLASLAMMLIGISLNFVSLYLWVQGHHASAILLGIPMSLFMLSSMQLMSDYFDDGGF